MIWLLFAATITLLLAIDLGVLSRRAHRLTFREALRWSAVVIGAAALFAVFVWLRRGRADATLFATGYVIELSLSVDNLLVFVLLLEYFRVPADLQTVALKWGILGAFVLRAVMITGGVVLLDRLSWLIYVLGGVLIVTGIRMAIGSTRHLRPQDAIVVRTAEHLLPVSRDFAGSNFFTRRNGRRMVTPLLLAIVAIESTDLLFATDSIPAIFAVTRNPFLVYTSNVFAIVGLRALYFVVAGVLERFTALRPAVSLLLVLVGVKMLLERQVHLSPAVVLGAVVVILGIAVVGSSRQGRRSDQPRRPGGRSRT